MPPTKNTSLDVHQLYLICKNDTNNFEDISPDILMQNPKMLLLFRLMLGMSQIQFGKFIGMNDTNLPKYELGKIKSMQQRTAEKYLNKICEQLKPNISETEVLKVFSKFSTDSKGWFHSGQDEIKATQARRKGAASLLANRATYQERALSIALIKLNIEHNVNYYLDSKYGIIVDLYIPKRNVIIECKDLKTKSRRMFRREVQKLAYQGYKINFYHNYHLIALLESEIKPSIIDIRELKGPFKEVFTDKKQLVLYLKDMNSV